MGKQQPDDQHFPGYGEYRDQLHTFLHNEKGVATREKQGPCFCGLPGKLYFYLFLNF